MTGHIRQRSPGSWELRYSLPSDPATGDRKVATITVRGTRKDAERELRRLLRALDTGEHVDPTRMTVRGYLLGWLSTVEQEVAPHSHERYASVVNNHLLPALGNLPIAKLAPSHIQTLYSATERHDGRPGALTARTRRHIHGVLHMALARAVEQQIIARNPCEVLRRRLPKVDPREMTVLTPAQSQMLLEAARGSRFYWPIMLALATGMRRGELLALRWRNVDIERSSLRVAESLEQTKTGLRLKPPKSGKARTVTLPSFAVDELRRRKVEQAEELLRLGVRQGGATAVCTLANGEGISPAALTNGFPRFLAAHPELPRIRFHDLRHTHATALLLANVHPRIVQERLGHASVAMTLDLYSHVTATMQEEAAGKIDAAFGKLPR